MPTSTARERRGSSCTSRRTWGFTCRNVGYPKGGRYLSPSRWGPEISWKISRTETPFRENSLPIVRNILAGISSERCQAKRSRFYRVHHSPQRLDFAPSMCTDCAEWCYGARRRGWYAGKHDHISTQSSGPGLDELHRARDPSFRKRHLIPDLPTYGFDRFDEFQKGRTALIATLLRQL